MMGDDGEKFGAWPTTWVHCWGERDWVERFFSALEANAGWLTTTTPSTWFESHRPIGRVYIPTSSYVEMGEWALPADESLIFTNVLHAAQEHHRPEARWLRGRSYATSRSSTARSTTPQADARPGQGDDMPAGAERKRALDHLTRASRTMLLAWAVGGIYISHMRLATYEHLIAAEDPPTGRRPAEATECRDRLDGLDDVRLASPDRSSRST
jgi:alpha-amylase